MESYFEGRESVRVAHVSRKRVPDSRGLKFEITLATGFAVKPGNRNESYVTGLREQEGPYALMRMEDRKKEECC